MTEERKAATLRMETPASRMISAMRASWPLRSGTTRVRRVVPESAPSISLKLLKMSDSLMMPFSSPSSTTGRMGMSRWSISLAARSMISSGWMVTMLVIMTSWTFMARASSRPFFMTVS
jgi:hypothetical protein